MVATAMERLALARSLVEEAMQLMDAEDKEAAGQAAARAIKELQQFKFSTRGNLR